MTEANKVHKATNILVVEDNQLDCKSIERMAKKRELPYNLSFAHCVADAKKMLESEHEYDIALFDYNLGDGLGLELLEYSKDIPSIFVTGMGSEEVAVEAINNGAYDYIIKDVEQNYLIILPTIISKVLKQKDNEIKLAQKTKELEESNQELSQFAYVASHDLQEPLRTIASFCTLLERRYKDKLDEDAGEFIDFIVNGTKRMQKLIDGLLLYSRAGRQSFDLEELDINILVEGIVKSLNQKLQETGAEVEFANLPNVEGSEIHLTQLFQNLISNAIRYCERRPKIKISARPIHRKIQFTIEDNGIGIAEENKEKIFQMFKRLHTQEEYEGSGIGLAVCKKIVERHGGDIWIESELGEGTKFHFTVSHA